MAWTPTSPAGCTSIGQQPTAMPSSNRALARMSSPVSVYSPTRRRVSRTPIWVLVCSSRPSAKAGLYSRRASSSTTVSLRPVTSARVSSSASDASPTTRVVLTQAMSFSMPPNHGPPNGGSSPRALAARMASTSRSMSLRVEAYRPSSGCFNSVASGPMGIRTDALCSRSASGATLPTRNGMVIGCSVLPLAQSEPARATTSPFPVQSTVTEARMARRPSTFSTYTPRTAPSSTIGRAPQLCSSMPMPSVSIISSATRFMTSGSEFSTQPSPSTAPPSFAARASHSAGTPSTQRWYGRSQEL